MEPTHDTAFSLGGNQNLEGLAHDTISRGLSRAATGWPGCQDEAPDAELLAVLDQAWDQRVLADDRTGRLKSPARLQHLFKGELGIPPTNVQFNSLRREHPIWTFDAP